MELTDHVKRQRAGHSSGQFWPALKIWWDRPRKVWGLREKGKKQKRWKRDIADEGIQWLFAGTLCSTHGFCPLRQTILLNPSFLLYLQNQTLSSKTFATCLQLLHVNTFCNWSIFHTTAVNMLSLKNNCPALKVLLGCWKGVGTLHPLCCNPVHLKPIYVCCTFVLLPLRVCDEYVKGHFPRGCCVVVTIENLEVTQTKILQFSH